MCKNIFKPYSDEILSMINFLYPLAHLDVNYSERLNSFQVIGNHSLFVKRGSPGYGKTNNKRKQILQIASVIFSHGYPSNRGLCVFASRSSANAIIYQWKFTKNFGRGIFTMIQMKPFR